MQNEETELNNDNFQYKNSSVSEKYNPSTSSSNAPSPQDLKIESMLWRASEFIEHQKSTAWFMVLMLVTFLIAGIVFFVSKDWLSTIVIVLAGITMAVFANQKPRTLTYNLIPSGIKIGNKYYNYQDFRSFSIMQDGALFSVILQPIKRILPPITIYFDEKDGEKIFDTLSQHLPHEQKELDLIDRLTRKVRF